MMKKFLKILKCIPVLLSRIAHVIEHMFCSEVPPVDFDFEESDSDASS